MNRSTILSTTPAIGIALLFISLSIIGCSSGPAQIYDITRGGTAEIWNLGAPINTAENEYAPVVVGDGSGLIFTRGRGEWTTSFRVTGSTDSTGKPSFTSTPVRILPPTYIRSCVMVAGRTMIFVGCDRVDGQGGCDLYELTNDGKPPVNLRILNGTGWESMPSLSADGRTIYYVHEGPWRFRGSRSEDATIYAAEKGGDGVWQRPYRMPGRINTSAAETAPSIAPNDSLFFFSSDRPGGLGGLDIYVCFRNGDGSWGNPYRLGPPFNSSDDDSFVGFGPDNDLYYISSNRGGGEAKGGYDIYAIRLTRGSLEE